MYLSLLKLDLRLLSTRKLLLDPYLLHQAICRAFPNATEGGHGRLLYRLDQDREAEIVNILVQSDKEPRWNKAELVCTCLAELPKVKPYNPHFSKGQVLYFRLRANPTVKRNGKRLGLLREEDQLRWLHRKASASGFSVLSCRLVSEGIEKSKKAKNKASDKDEPMSFLSVRFDGVLRVEDPEVFLHTIQTGIGSGKGMGFGLLSIAPPQE